GQVPQCFGDGVPYLQGFDAVSNHFCSLGVAIDTKYHEQPHQPQSEAQPPSGWDHRMGTNTWLFNISSTVVRLLFGSCSTILRERFDKCSTGLRQTFGKASGTYRNAAEQKPDNRPTISEQTPAG